MDNEVWRPVPDYEGIYEISTYGRLRGLPRHDCRGMFRPGVVFTPGKGSSGYALVTLSKDGRQRSALIHQLVARVFFGPVPRGKEVNHKDGNKMNAALENLEYVTKSEQQMHRYHVLGIRAAHGEAHYAAKLTKAQAQAVRVLHASGNFSGRAIARMFHVTHSNVQAILRGQTWV